MARQRQRGDEAAAGGSDRWDSEAVRRLRERLGVSQAELADRIGTRQQTISEWETGTSTPRRMSGRLLRMVAEEAGLYDAGAPARASDDCASDRGASDADPEVGA